jgi:hypothetical protein
MEGRGRWGTGSGCRAGRCLLGEGSSVSYVDYLRLFQIDFVEKCSIRLEKPVKRVMNASRLDTLTIGTGVMNLAASTQLSFHL